MPNTSSATKALRQAVKRTKTNAAFKVKLKKALKAASKETMAQTTSLIDKAVKNNLMHKHKAARLKSQLSKAHGIATAKRPGAGAAAPAKKAAKATK